jgi:hypothetical protein
MAYSPPRQPTPRPTGAPLEVDLVFNLIACGTCDFFWPADPSAQVYGPYPTFDISMNPPPPKDPPASTTSFSWVEATTAAPAFPLPEVLDGCRKAPIMTIGINPNLTAFAPGQAGTAWCYPSFSDDQTADLWTKYAYYYRYRSVFQESFALDWVRQFLLPEPRVVAAKGGSVVSALRPTDAPSFDLHVRYDGDQVDTVLTLQHDLGTPRWVVLFDSHGPTSRFEAGDVLAGKLDVPAGQTAQIYRQQVGYYEQFVPVMEAFQQTIRASGHPDAELQMGEDVCQLDMVATASPHWNPGFLGGSEESVQTIVDNCVSKNAYAIKQLVQTRPAVLYLVGEATYDMFRAAFGALLQRDPVLSVGPSDGAFTLLRETTDPGHPCLLKFDTTIDGVAFSVSTRIVVTPHFSYSSNFIPQIRLSPSDWATIKNGDPACATALTSSPKVIYQPAAQEIDYVAFLVGTDAGNVLADLATRFPQGADVLKGGFYDPHAMMADVLNALYSDGTLAYGPVAGGTLNALGRTEGSCRFCVNEHWSFAGECRYGKTTEPTPAPGYLEQVAAALVAAGPPTAPTRAPAAT